jgi:hypothetical protein
MKQTVRIFCTLILFVYNAGIVLNAQTVDADDICIAINSKEYLYAGFDNPVKLAVAGVPFKELRFECSNAQISMGATLTIKPDTLGIVTLKAYRGTQLVANFRFRAVQAVSPVAGLNGKNSGSITKEELALIGQLELFADPSIYSATTSRLPYNTLFRITSFTLYLASRDGFSINQLSYSNRFTSDMLRAFKNLRPGNRIYFDEIIAESVNGETLELRSISLKIR